MSKIEYKRPAVNTETYRRIKLMATKENMSIINFIDKLISSYEAKI
jgi:hypothetical protein